MPCEIIWLPDAAKDVERLRQFIYLNNPDAAERAARRILECSHIIAENPMVGRPVEDRPELKELIIPFGNGSYILRYRKLESKLIIIRVRHSRESSYPLE